MFKSIWEDIKLAFNQGNMVIRLIFVNVAIFVVMAILPLFVKAIDFQNSETIYWDIVHFFCISDDWYTNLLHLWSVFTHMFLHTDFFHLLWNMLFLYWFGRITGDLLGDRHILPLYLLGGLFGALIYFLSATLLPDYYLVGSYALGASAAVMAIVAAAGVTAPDYTIHLFLLGPIRLKFIVGVLILLDIVGIGSLSNTGGHFAHLGGVFLGYMYVNQMRSNGADWSVPVNRTIDSISTFFSNIFKSNKGPRKVYKNPDASKFQKSKGSARSDKTATQGSHQEALDSILDKIKRDGYDSLSSEEKEFLFNASKKN